MGWLAGALEQSGNNSLLPRLMSPRMAVLTWALAHMGPVHYDPGNKFVTANLFFYR